MIVNAIACWLIATAAVLVAFVIVTGLRAITDTGEEAAS